MRVVIAFLILTASLSACIPASEFCDIAQDLRADRELAAIIYDTDETLARKMAVHNADYARCG